MGADNILYIYLIAVVLPFAALIAWLALKDRPEAKFALKVRPVYASVSRKLTDDEIVALSEGKVEFVDTEGTPLQGWIVVEKAQLEKVAEVLKMDLGEKFEVTPYVEGIRCQILNARADSFQSTNTAPAQTITTTPATTGARPSIPVTEPRKVEPYTPRTDRPFWERPSNERPSTGSWWQSESEAPFAPHSFFPKAEMLKPPRAPKVVIWPDAYRKMLLYVEFAPKEVGWLGTVTQRANGDFVIEDVYLLRQEVTAVETELSNQGIEELCMELIAEGDAGIAEANKLRFWGHSHVRMGVEPSGTDESTMVRFGDHSMPWYVRGIFNKLGKAKFTVYLYDKNYRVIDAPWCVEDPATGQVLRTDKSAGSFGFSTFSGFGSSNKPNKPWAKPATPAKPVEKPAEAKVEGEKVGEKPVVTQTAAAAVDGDKAVANATSEEKVTEVAPAADKATDTAEGAKVEAVVEAVVEEAPAPVVVRRHFTDNLPDILRPSAELRQAVMAEYRDKVNERTWGRAWGGYYDTRGTWWTTRDDDDKPTTIVNEPKKVDVKTEVTKPEASETDGKDAPRGAIGLSVITVTTWDGRHLRVSPDDVVSRPDGRFVSEDGVLVRLSDTVTDPAAAALLARNEASRRRMAEDAAAPGLLARFWAWLKSLFTVPVTAATEAEPAAPTSLIVTPTETPAQTDKAATEAKPEPEAKR